MGSTGTRLASTNGTRAPRQAPTRLQAVDSQKCAGGPLLTIVNTGKFSQRISDENDCGVPQAGSPAISKRKRAASRQRHPLDHTIAAVSILLLRGLVWADKLANGSHFDKQGMCLR